MRILIVDDDAKFRGYLGQGLRESGVDCVAAGDAEEAAAALRGSDPPFDLVLLDVMMPGRSGWELLESLRGGGDQTPVIFVSARGAVDERIQGLRLGADDYILKPFEFGELLARIEAVERRRRSLPSVTVGDLRLDLAGRTAERGGQRIELSPKEFDLLRALADAGGEVVSRPELLSAVWGIGFDPETNLVDALVARLRRRIDRVGPPLIETVVGRGYRLAVHGRSER